MSSLQMYGIGGLKLKVLVRFILCLYFFIFILNRPLLASVSQKGQLKTSFQEKKELSITSAIFPKEIDVSNYRTRRFTVKKGQTLSSILQPYGISVLEVLRLCNKADSFFDPRRMTAGQTYFIVHELGNKQKVRYFLLEKSIEELIVFEFDSSPRAFTVKKNGKMVDYSKIDLPDGQPVDIACLDDFNNYLQQIKFNLEEKS